MDGRGQSLALVVAAAGQGVRFESKAPKQFVPLLGIPMLERTLRTLDACDRVDALAIVVNSCDLEYCRRAIGSGEIAKVVAITAGGDNRSLSVRNGLRALVGAGSWDLVGIHDGARPLVTCGDVGRAVDTLVADAALDGVVLAVPSTDTIKTVNDDGFITSTPDRRYLWRAQTPQVFRWPVLQDAYEQPEEVLLRATDDASLVEQVGGRLKVVAGSAENLKVTEPSDLWRAEQILAARSK
jgi:2-C-methyl-D-erythritol 4-phosphate cytidylyltransferase